MPLRPPPEAEFSAGDSIGLAADLCSLAERLREQWAIAVEVSVEPHRARLPIKLRFDLHQLVRESAANAVRHGKASRLSIVALAKDEQLRLEIENDGFGFPFERRYSGEDCTISAIGLQSIAWRVSSLAGTLSVGPGAHGAQLSIVIPLVPQPARKAA